MNLIFLVVGLVVSSAVPPLAFLLTWSKVPRGAAITAALGGQAAAIIAWLVHTQVVYGAITQDTSQVWPCAHWLHLIRLLGAFCTSTTESRQAMPFAGLLSHVSECFGVGRITLQQPQCVSGCGYADDPRCRGQHTGCAQKSATHSQNVVGPKSMSRPLRAAKKDADDRTTPLLPAEHLADHGWHGGRARRLLHHLHRVDADRS